MKVSDKYYKCFVYKNIDFSIIAVVVGVFANCFRRFSSIKIIWSLVNLNQNDLDDLDHPVITSPIKKNTTSAKIKKTKTFFYSIYLEEGSFIHQVGDEQSVGCVFSTM